MASFSSSNPLYSFTTLLLLLGIISCSCIQISHARESMFFSKFIHFATNDDAGKPKFPSALAPSPAPAPTSSQDSVPMPAPAFSPEITFTENGNPYGLYGQVGPNDELPIEKEAVNGGTIDQHKFKSEEFSNTNGWYDPGYPTKNMPKNKHRSSYDTNNDYVNGRQGMSDTRFMQNYQVSNNDDNKYNNNKGYVANSSGNNGYRNEKQGMSDTRFLENGKYYYNEKNNANYYPSTTNTANEYESTKNEGGYHGNTQNAYEFDTMEEYEKQMGYQQSPETYMP